MAALYGLMMETPLLLITLLDYAAKYHGETEIVTRSVEGPIHRYDYRRCYARTAQLAHALRAFGIREGDCIGTLAWNTYRHLELYYAAPGIGAVCHTINPRLFPEQIGYIVNHAEDRVLFVDLTFVPLLERLAPALRSVEAYVILTDKAHMPQSSLPNALCYETLIKGHPEIFDWPALDERAAAILCYTSGTTGDPKGVLYSHRSLMLYTLNIGHRDAAGYGSSDSVLPVVPMFHVNAWGIPFGAPLGGSKLVFPGAKLDPENLYALLADEGVTVTAGVPTVWAALLDYMRRTGKRLTTLRSLGIGGAAASRAMVDAFEREFGIPVVHGWGMTETSASATNSTLPAREQALPYEARLAYKLKQGRRRCFIEMKVVDEAGRELPCDGESAGELLVRGPWIARGYFKDAAASRAALDAAGWLRTGDIATLDARGFVQIVDRKKDMIKSGGEWISSIAIENMAAACPGIAEAAVIARPDPRWGERPLLVLRRAEGARVEAQEVVDFLRHKMAKWAVPDEVIFLDELPHTATGKVAKHVLRQQLVGDAPPTVRA
ncbi:MAG TPA: long-chain fatty acid--CoA ligase [Alphaproteobacteria bacterium]|nr:long-chain fatty acid--CoA ligase [Alphaproteobacteria bacterium]